MNYEPPPDASVCCVDGIGDLAGGPPARRSEKLQLQRSEEFVWGSDQSAPENCIKTKLFFFRLRYTRLEFIWITFLSLRRSSKLQFLRV